MNKFLKILAIFFIGFFLSVGYVNAQNEKKVENSAAHEKQFVARDFILEHLEDAYEWHITNWGRYSISVPLPVIVHSSKTGWHVFMSSVFRKYKVYDGFYIATNGKYKSKVVELNYKGQEVRPIDISITKNVLALIISSFILVFIILFVAKSYKRSGYKPSNGFVALMEMFIMNINDEVIKPCVGKDYKKYAPYLLTLFFFLFTNNLLGLIPIFPFGANLTGNIAITFLLALITFIIVSVSGTKEYWKEIIWPDVPMFLKAPIPLFPILEIISMFSRPFALMIRLFSNMIAGHSIVIGLISIIFLTVSLGHAANTSLTFVSILLSIFVSLVEFLIAFIQAYIFTLLSAVYIGLAKVEPHHK